MPDVPYTPYAPYMPYMPYVPYASYMPYAPYAPYAPYMHCLQESDWLMSPPHPIRSMELNNLINIKS